MDICSMLAHPGVGSTRMQAAHSAKRVYEFTGMVLHEVVSHEESSDRLKMCGATFYALTDMQRPP